MAKTTRQTLTDIPPTASALVGVGRRDITPPVGIYARMWGAAKHDISEGTHRPISTTALAIRKNAKSDPMILISIDIALLGALGDDEDERRVMAPLRAALKLDRSRILINGTHTHAGTWASRTRDKMPGGHMIPAYMEHLGQAMLEAAREAINTATPATFTWATGRCSLATNRDLPDPDAKGPNPRVVCGFNPAIRADDTVMVGRITRNRDDQVLATIVNYACHPTTLAWLNKFISPDYIGSMREVVEGHTGGAPCLFLQGASGEMAPAHQYVGDVSVADKHGRQLGYAALSALESMLPPRHLLAYQGVVESGAPLAWWLPEPFEPPTDLAAVCIDVPMPLKPMPTVAEMERLIATTKDRAMRERHFRKLQIVKALGSGKTKAMPAWVWRIGRALFIGQPNESYSVFQVQLRKMFPDYAVVVMNCCGAEVGYVCPADKFKQNIYQVWQTPFNDKAQGVLTRACVAAGRRLTSRVSDSRGKRGGSKTGRRRAITTPT